MTRCGDDEMQFFPLLIRELYFDVMDIYKIEDLLDKNADIHECNIQGENALSIVIKRSKTWLGKRALKPYDNSLRILDAFFRRVKREFFIDRETTVERLRGAMCPVALIPFMRNVEITSYFLSRSNDFIQRVGDLTILHVAVMLTDLENVRLLANHLTDLNAVDDNGRTALFAYNVEETPDSLEKIEMLKILLDHGASLSLPNNMGVTPMEYLLKNGNSHTRMIVLEKCKAKEETPIHFLLQNKYIDFTLKKEIRILVNRGFDVNERDKRGINVLTMAVKSKPSIVKFLVKNGAEVSWTEITAETHMLHHLSDRFYHDEASRDYYQWLVALIFQYQLGINIKQLFKELNKGVTRKIDDQFYAQIVIAQLTIEEAIGECLPISAYTCMRYSDDLKEHYSVCKNRIEEFKTVIVCDSVTLYQLLTASDAEIDRYICNQTLIVELENLFSQECYQNLYYVAIIQKRVENAVKILKIRKNCGRVICQFTGLNMYGVTEDHYVVYKIVNYLTNRDILNLFEGQQMSYKNRMSFRNTPRILRNLLNRSFKKIFS